MNPTKFQYAGFTSALCVVIVWLAGLAGVAVPPEVASAGTVVVAGLVGWKIPESAPALSTSSNRNRPEEHRVS